MPSGRRGTPDAGWATAGTDRTTASAASTSTVPKVRFCISFTPDCFSPIRIASAGQCFPSSHDPHLRGSGASLDGTNQIDLTPPCAGHGRASPRTCAGRGYAVTTLGGRATLTPHLRGAEVGARQFLSLRSPHPARAWGQAGQTSSLSDARRLTPHVRGAKPPKTAPRAAAMPCRRFNVTRRFLTGSGTASTRRPPAPNTAAGRAAMALHPGARRQSGATHAKFAASSMLPLPVYRATCG